MYIKYCYLSMTCFNLICIYLHTAVLLDFWSAPPSSQAAISFRATLKEDSASLRRGTVPCRHGNTGLAPTIQNVEVPGQAFWRMYIRRQRKPRNCNPNECFIFTVDLRKWVCIFWVDKTSPSVSLDVVFSTKDLFLKHLRTLHCTTARGVQTWQPHSPFPGIFLLGSNQWFLCPLSENILWKWWNWSKSMVKLEIGEIWWNQVKSIGQTCMFAGRFSSMTKSETNCWKHLWTTRNLCSNVAWSHHSHYSPTRPNHQALLRSIDVISQDPQYC